MVLQKLSQLSSYGESPCFAEYWCLLYSLTLYCGYTCHCFDCYYLFHFFMQIFVQKKVVDVREQLSRLLRRLGLALKSCEKDTQAFILLFTCPFFTVYIVVLTICFCMGLAQHKFHFFPLFKHLVVPANIHSQTIIDMPGSCCICV